MAGLFVSVVIAAVFHLSGVWAACSEPVHLNITAPRKIEALEGSCLQIPCNYSTGDRGAAIFDKTRQIFGVWIKNNTDFQKHQNNVIFNSSEQNNIYPINITDLRENNCTSLFSNLNKNHTDTYFFRIENKPFEATARCDGVHITVKDSAWSPDITISGDLKENKSVTITCSAVTPCPHSPPELTWNLQQDSHTQTKKNKDGTLKTKIQKIFTLSDTHDGYNISCSARYPVDGGKPFKKSQTVKTLSVSYAPKNTSASISPAGLVSAGSWVNLTCSSRANPPVSSFTWFKKSEHGHMEEAEGDFYSLNVTDGGVYYCVAKNDVGNQTSPDIHLNVEGHPDGFLLWTIIVGIIGFIFLVGFVCIVIWLRRTKKTDSTVQQLQKKTNRGTEEETIHYGEINFSKRTSEPSSNSVQESRRELDTVYSQVKVSEPANQSQTTDGLEDLYAQVKKN